MMLRRVENSYKELLESTKTVPCEEANKAVDQFTTNHPILFSPRCRSRITNIERLLHELDKSLLIQPLNVEYFGEIVTILENTTITSLYRKHCNLVDQYLIYEQQSRQNGTSDPHSGVQSQMSNGLPAEVKRVVVEKIGTKWKELGRQLSVPEGRLDYINETCQEPYSRVYKVFDDFECKFPVADHKSRLLKGLQKTKRKDLAEEVQNLLLI